MNDVMLLPISEPPKPPTSLQVLLERNAHWRQQPWPNRFANTTHELRVGDARRLDWIEDQSVHLVITSPPYFTLKKYTERDGQLGLIRDYGSFLDQLDLVWRECSRILVPGGRVCCVVGDVCLPRRKAGRHRVLPLHADITVRASALGFENLTPILWAKIANGATEGVGNGAGFFGKPYQPGVIVKADFEYLVFFRKPGYRRPSRLQQELSMLTRAEMQSWVQPMWTDITNAVRQTIHPAPFPPELAERLVRLFSFAGDRVADPFGGLCNTALGALRAGRNSVVSDIEPRYVDLGVSRVRKVAAQLSFLGPLAAQVITPVSP